MTCPDISLLASYVDGIVDPCDRSTEHIESQRLAVENENTIPSAYAEDVLSHIAACTKCQQVLDWMGGDASWWDQSKSSLGKTLHDKRQLQATTKIVESVCALSNQPASYQSDPLCEHEIEQLSSLLDAASHPELLGRIGRYEVEQLVGRGGMGLVFRGYDTELHRVVAIKTLAIHLIPVTAARERFVREGRACASLIHPHIVPVHDVITEGPVPALVMQFVAGPTLDQWLARRGPLHWSQALQLMLQLTEALVSAHERGFVHRDVKPGNVLLEVDGARALLTDFGLVRTLDDATLTRSGMLAGTPDYMSPEQARGESVDARSDLFSLGSLFATMLTGAAPFRAPEPMAVMNRICHDTPSLVEGEKGEIPEVLQAIVARLLEKSPERRFQSARELSTAFRTAQLHLQDNPPSANRVQRQRCSAARRKKIVSGTVATALALVIVFSVLNGSWLRRPLRDAGGDAAGQHDQAVAREYFAPDTGNAISESNDGSTNGSTGDSSISLDTQTQQLQREVDQLLFESSQEQRLRTWNPESAYLEFENNLQQLHQKVDRLESEFR